MSWAWIGSGRLAASTTATAALDNIRPSLTGPSFPWIQASAVSMSPDHRGRERAQPVGTNHAPAPVIGQGLWLRSLGQRLVVTLPYRLGVWAQGLPRRRCRPAPDGPGSTTVRHHGHTRKPR